MSPLERGSRWAAGVLAAAMTLALVAPGVASASPNDPKSQAVASGNDWTVTRVAGGFKVTKYLSKPLPIRASAPVLQVDGDTLGPATESADGMSLSVLTADQGVAQAGAVSVSGLSAEKKDSGAQRPGTPNRSDGAVPGKAPETLDPTVLAADPAQRGDHAVTEGVYAFGEQAIPLLNIGGIRGELEGKIYLPDGRGPKPTVIFLHGRHASCYGPGERNPDRWPCTSTPDSDQDRAPIPSYIGYDAPARTLASNGYAVVSISANSINANDNQLAADYGAQARGELILDTLRMLKKANAGSNPSYYDAFTDNHVSLRDALDAELTPADLVGQFDLENVGIMGHSRGGEGVVAASTLNDALALRQQFGIKAVLPLAPVDYDRFSMPNVATAVVMGYCDGDVENLMGQHIIDDSRHNFGDNVLRSSMIVMGGNHNYFNTIWTPGGWPEGTSDDWDYANSDDPVCTEGAADSTRLSPQEQVDVGTAYIAGFFRLTLGGDEQFLDLYDGADVIAPSVAGFADIRVTATQPGAQRRDINTFEVTDPSVRVYGDARGQTCASMDDVMVPQALPFCTTTLNQAAVPHWSPALWAFNIPSSPMMHLTWTSTSGQMRVTVPRSARDMSSFSQLSVKMAADEFVGNGTDVTISVIDGSGHTWSSLVSELNPDAVSRLPGTTSDWLSKIILQQVTVPLTDLTELDITDVREVRFSGAVGADATATGGVHVSDLSVENTALGGRVPAQQATVDLGATVVNEGDGPGTAEVATVLSEAVDHPVSTYVSAYGSAEGKAGVTMQKVTFAPGVTCIPVSVATYGDNLPSSTALSSFKVTATNVAGAVMGDHGFSTLTVREDDGVVGGVPAPAVGNQGDACAEYRASISPGRLKVTPRRVAPLDTVTMTARGYRPGESVSFSLGGKPVGRAVAYRDGVVVYATRVPADTPLGRTQVKAVGAGSGHLTQARLTIVSRAATTRVSPQ